MTRRSGSVISLKNIFTAYEGGRDPVIRGLSLEIDRGEFVMVGGPNGAGKTTLLESINGMLSITHGSAQVCGFDVRSRGADVRKKVGYVIQNFNFDPLDPFTARQVVMMGRYGQIGFFRRPSNADYAAVERAAALLGIEDLMDTPIGMLSGGQQQKILIAQNVAKEPEILLLDEPFSNLDLAAREFISDVLLDLVKSGIAIVIVSHAFDDLPDHPMRVLVMNSGRITLNAICPACEVEDLVRRASLVRAVNA